MSRNVSLAVIAFAMLACTDATAPAGRSAAIRVPASRLVLAQSISPQLATGGLAACALKNNGEIVCWGSNQFGQLDVPADQGPFSQVGVGNWYACALRVSGGVVCWGTNQWGAMFPPPGLTDVRQLSVGGAHTCVLYSAGTVQCWGVYGAKPPADLSSVSTLSSGGNGACALKSDASVVCWGYDAIGHIPVPADLGPASAVAAGTYHNCAILTGGTIRCWGVDGGNYMPPAGLTSLVQASAEQQTCALKSDGSVACWGGVEAFGAHLVPADLGTATQVSAGWLYSCAILATGAVRCWGSDSYGTVSSPSDLNVLGTVATVATVTTARTSPAGQQYSDKIDLTATVSPSTNGAALATGVVQFKIDGVAVGSPQPVVSGSATLSGYALEQREGSHNLTAEFTSTSAKFESSTSAAASFTITAEDAVVTPAPANENVFKTDGGPAGTASVSFSFMVTEKTPDMAGLAAAPGSGYFMYLQTVLHPATGADINLTCTNSVTGTGYATANTLWCNAVDVPIGTYEFRGTVVGGYYQGSYVMPVTVSRAGKIPPGQGKKG